ncbi:MAG TPA: leucyl aminopeptidase [Acidobacteriota bacterium]
MKLGFSRAKLEEVETDVLVLPMFEDEDQTSSSFAALKDGSENLVAEVLQSREFRGKLGEFYLIPRPPKVKAKRLLLCGAGKQRVYDANTLRQFMSTTFAKLRQINFGKVAVFDRGGVDADAAACAAVEGLIMALYDPEEYKTSNRGTPRISEMTFVSSAKVKRDRILQKMERARILAECTNFARHLINQPGNIINPLVLAQKARDLAKEGGLKIDVLDEKQMRQKGMNALLSVAKGSSVPPRLIVMRYRPLAGMKRKHRQRGPLALVGKGVTFDTGGISLKPAQSMEEMKADKAGACAVLGAMKAIAKLKPNREIFAVIPSVENMPSGTAQRPGDVVKSFSGKTIEITNTDAEGRLILADALAYARRLGAAEIVDIATLTGACVVALGHVCAGLFSSNGDLRDRLLESGRRAGEKLWQLPLDDEYKKEIQSEIADMKNSGGRPGGACYAAKFLHEFVGDTAWAHLDIAGVDLFKDETSPLKGASGFGVRTLVEFCFL